jgi:prepilin-type N-terminal cleavage/methylation domain-containing protein
MGKITTDKRAGFTLMELMVYIAIVGIVVIVAGQAFSNSTKMRVRTQSMLKASEVAENVAALFKQDVAQTGAKSSMEGGGAAGGDNFSAVNDSVYMDPGNADDDLKDYSSFSVTNAGNFSDLKMRRMRYTEEGYFQSVEEVNWFVENGKLMRSCRTINGTEDAENCKKGTPAETKNRAVEIAEGVTRFEVRPAVPGVTSDQKAQIFPLCDATGACPGTFRMVARTGTTDFRDFSIESSEDHKTVTFSGFVTNYNKNTNEENETGKWANQAFATENTNISVGTTWKNSCYKFTLMPMTEYEIMFSLSDGGVNEKTRMFVPNRDQMSVGFRYTTTGERPVEIDDFLFFPPADDRASGNRSVRFSVPKKIEKVCLAFTFASYSPIAADGEVVLSDLVFKKVETSNYKFDGAASISLQDKKNVKAMQLLLSVNRNGEGSNDTLIIRTPSNGLSD